LAKAGQEAVCFFSLASGSQRHSLDHLPPIHTAFENQRNRVFFLNSSRFLNTFPVVASIIFLFDGFVD